MPKLAHDDNIIMWGKILIMRLATQCSQWNLIHCIHLITFSSICKLPQLFVYNLMLRSVCFVYILYGKRNPVYISVLLSGKSNRLRWISSYFFFLWKSRYSSTHRFAKLCNSSLEWTHAVRHWNKFIGTCTKSIFSLNKT